MNTPTLRRRSLGLLLVTGLGLTVAACGESTDDGAGEGGKVAITVNGQPPKTQPFERKIFDEDVAEFERTHKNIDIQPREGFMDPKTFSTKLAGGQLEDVYYVFLTDPANLISRKQAADVTDYVKDVPHYDEIQPTLKEIFTRDGKVYGLPTANYSMGLLYNRKLFTEAGLDPDSPPSTWEEVREAAKKITALGNNKIGFAEYSKNNQGGWHYTSWLYSVGGNVAKQDGDKWVADFNNDKGKQVAQYLHDMRWADNTMGSKQLLVIEDVQRMMGAGQLGMYLAAPDNVPALVNQFKGDYANYGLAPMPGGNGTLIGGEGYMLNPKATPEKIKAGLQWISWKYLNPDRMESDLKRYADQKQPIGLPASPPAGASDIWTGPLREQQATLKTKYATVPVENYQPFVDGLADLDKKIEPPNAQQVYAALDNVMQGVLTNKDANIDDLLAAAETKVNAALAQVK